MKYLGIITLMMLIVIGCANQKQYDPMDPRSDIRYFGQTASSSYKAGVDTFTTETFVIVPVPFRRNNEGTTISIGRERITDRGNTISTSHGITIRPSVMRTNQVGLKIGKRIMNEELSGYFFSVEVYDRRPRNESFSAIRFDDQFMRLDHPAVFKSQIIKNSIVDVLIHEISEETLERLLNARSFDVKLFNLKMSLTPEQIYQIKEWMDVSG